MCKTDPLIQNGASEEEPEVRDPNLNLTALPNRPLLLTEMHNPNRKMHNPNLKPYRDPSPRPNPEPTPNPNPDQVREMHNPNPNPDPDPDP